VEAGRTYSIQSLDYVMDDLYFESRERQEITSLLLNMSISSGCTQTVSQRILAAVSKRAWRSEREADHSPPSSRDIKKRVAMHLSIAYSSS
jgi:hypothetical protein